MEPSQNWVGIYFHDPLPFSVRGGRKSHLVYRSSKAFTSQSRVSCSIQLLQISTNSTVHRSGPVRARGSHFLLGSRSSTLAFSSLWLMNYKAPFFFHENTPNASGPSVYRKIQKKTAQKVIDSSDFLLLFPCDTRAVPEKGGVLVQRTTLNTTKRTTVWTDRNTKGDSTEGGLSTSVRGGVPPVLRPFLPVLAALSLSSSLPLCRAVAVLCYRKRCGPRSAATSSTLLTQSDVAFKDFTTAPYFDNYVTRALQQHFSLLPYTSFV